MLVEHRGKWAYQAGTGRKRRRLSTGYDATPENRDAAERAASAIKHALGQPVGDTITAIMEAYLNDAKERVVDYDRLANAWKRLKPFFGDVRPENITRNLCRDYIKKRREVAKDGTILKELRTLRAGLNWHEPQTKAVFEFPSQPEPRDRFLTREEFDRLLEAAKDTHHLTVFLHLAIATAGRKEAILQLTWLQVNWERNEIWLGKKQNGKNRARVPMTDKLRSVLQTAHELQKGSNFIIEHGKAQKTALQSVRTAFANACTKAGLSHVTIHDLRHTAAIWMCEKGVPLEKIADYLGHTDLSVTRRVYARYQPEHLREAAEALEV